MKYFACSDIHGFYDKWMKALKAAGFQKDNPEHILIVCGDLLDRGPQPLETIKFILSLPENRVVYIRGNHEILMEEMIERGYHRDYDRDNGTSATILKSTKLFKEYDFAERCRFFWQKYFVFLKKRMVDYFEVGNHIFVHGWVPIRGEQQARGQYVIERDWKQGDWDDAVWINGQEAWMIGYVIPGKTIVCGHRYCWWYRSHFEGETPRTNTAPFIRDGIMAIDALTKESGVVNCVVIDA